MNNVLYDVSFKVLMGHNWKTTTFCANASPAHWLSERGQEFLVSIFWTHVKFSLHLFWAVRNGVWHFWEFAGSSFKVPTPCQTNFCLWGGLSRGVRVKKSKVKKLFWADLTISFDTKECLHLVLRIHKFRIIDDTKCIWKKTVMKEFSYCSHTNTNEGGRILMDSY